MRVLWHWKNWIRIEVALDHEFQITFGFVYTYPGETFPWTLTIHFICFRVALAGRVNEEMERRRQLYYGSNDDADDYETEW